MPTCPTLFLRKQQHWPITWETQLDFQPNTTRVEAGTVVWWNYTCFASIGITSAQTDNQKQKVIRYTPPSNCGESVQKILTIDGAIILVIESTPTSYRLGYRQAQDATSQECTWLGEVDTQVMTRSPEIGQPFTGMMMGLYSFGELQPVLEPAHFSYAEFR